MRFYWGITEEHVAWMIDNCWTCIRALDGGGIMRKMALPKGFADELHRPSVRKMQKRARMRPAATMCESWSDFEFPDLPPPKEIPGAELDAQFVRDATGNVIEDGDDGTEWYQLKLPPSSPVRLFMEGSVAEDAVPEEIVAIGKRYIYHHKGPQKFVDFKLHPKKPLTHTESPLKALCGESMFE